MQAMCRDAVNRAALYLELQKEGLSDVFSIYSIPGLNWDVPNTNTLEAQNIRKTLTEIKGKIDKYDFGGYVHFMTICIKPRWVTTYR